MAGCLVLKNVDSFDYDQSDFLIGSIFHDPEDKYCLISPSGFLLSRPIYDEIRLTGSGILFKRGRIHGYLDSKGKEIIRKWPGDEGDE